MKGDKKGIARLRDAGFPHAEMFEGLMGLLRAGRVEEYRTQVLDALRKGGRPYSVLLCSLMMDEIARSLAEQVNTNPWDDRMKIRAAQSLTPPEGYSDDTCRLAAYYAARDTDGGHEHLIDVATSGDRLAALLVSLTKWYCEVRGFESVPRRTWKE